MAFPIKGLNKAIERFKKADRKLAGDTLKRGLRNGAKVTKNYLIPTLPVRTGTLKRSVKVRSGKNNVKKRVFRMKLVSSNPGGDDDGFYMSFLEAGTKFISSRHYMKNAANACRKEVASAVVKEIKSVF